MNISENRQHTHAPQTPSPRAVFFAATPPPTSPRHTRRPGSHSSSASDSPSNLAFNLRAAAMAASTAPLYAAAALRSPQAIAASQYPTQPRQPQQSQQHRPQSSIGRRQTQSSSPVGWTSPPPRPRSSLGGRSGGGGGAGGGGFLSPPPSHAQQHQRNWSTPPSSQPPLQQQHTWRRASVASSLVPPVALSRAQLLSQWSAEKAARASFLNGALYTSAAPPALPYSPSSSAGSSQVSSTTSLMQQHQWTQLSPSHHPPSPPLSVRSMSPGHSNGNHGHPVPARPPSSSRPHTPASAMKGGRAHHHQQQYQAHLRAASAVSTTFSDGSLMIDDLSQSADEQQEVFIIRPTHLLSPQSKAPRPSAASPFSSYFSAAGAADEHPSASSAPALHFASHDCSAASNGDLHSPVSAHAARARLLREQRAALADQDALVPELPLLLASGPASAAATSPPPGPHDPLPIEPHLTPAPIAAPVSSLSPSASHARSESAPRWQVAEDHFWCSWSATRLCDARALSLDAQLIRLASFCATERGASLLVSSANSNASPASLMLPHALSPRANSSYGHSRSSMLDLTSAELASLLLIAPLPLLLCLLDCYIAAGRSFLSFPALEHALSLSVCAHLSRWRSRTMSREGILVPPSSDPAWQSYLAQSVRPFVQSMEAAAREAATQRKRQEDEEERRAQYVFGMPPPPKPEETAVARDGRDSDQAQEAKEEAEAEQQKEAAAAAAAARAEAKRKKLASAAASAAAAASASQPLSPAHLQRLESLEAEIRELRSQLQMQSQSQGGNGVHSESDSSVILHAPAPHARQTADSSSTSASRRTSATSSSAPDAATDTAADAAAGDPAVATDATDRHFRFSRASQERAEHVIPHPRSSRRASGPGPTIGTTILPESEADAEAQQRADSAPASAGSSKRASGTAAAQNPNTDGSSVPQHSQSSLQSAAAASVEAAPATTAASAAALHSEPASAASATASPSEPVRGSESASNSDGTILSFMQPRPKGHTHSPSIVPEESDCDTTGAHASSPNPATDPSSSSATGTAATSPRFVPSSLVLAESPNENDAQAPADPALQQARVQQQLADWAVNDHVGAASDTGSSSSSRAGSGPLTYRPLHPLASAGSFLSAETSATGATQQQSPQLVRSSSDREGRTGNAPTRDLSHNSPTYSLRAMAARNAALRNSGGGGGSPREHVVAASSHHISGRVMSIDTKYDTMSTRSSRSSSPPGSPFSSPTAAAAGILLSPALHVRRVATPQTPPDTQGGTRSRSGSFSALGGGGDGGGGTARGGGATTPSRAMTPRPRLPAPAAVIVGPVPMQRLIPASSSVPTTPGGAASAATNATAVAPGHMRSHSRFTSRGGSLTPLPLSSLVSSGVLPTAVASEQQELLEAVLHDYPAPETNSVVAARSRANSLSKRGASAAGDIGLDSFHRRHAAASSGANHSHSHSTAILPLDELNEQNLPLFASAVLEESASVSSSSTAPASREDSTATGQNAATAVNDSKGAGNAESSVQSQVAVTAPASAVDSILSAAALAAPAATSAPVAVPNLRHPVVSMEQVASFLLWASPSLFFSPSRMRTTLTTNDVEYLVQIAHTELSALQHLQALQKLSKQYEDFHALLLAVHELQTFRVHRRDYVVASLSYPRCTLFSRSPSAVTVDAQDIDWLVDACNGEVEWIDYICCMLDVHSWRVSDDPGVATGAPGALGGFGKLMKVVYKLYSAVGEEQKKLKKFLTFDPESNGTVVVDSRRSSSTSDGGAGVGGPVEIQYPVPLRLLRDSNNLPRTMDSSEVDDLCHRLKPLQHVSGLWAFMRREQAKAVAEHYWMQEQLKQQNQAAQQTQQQGEGGANPTKTAAPAPPLLHKAASGFRVDLSQAAALATAASTNAAASSSSSAGPSSGPASVPTAAPLFPPLESALPPLLLLQSFALDRLSFRTPLTLFQALWECGDYPPVPPFIHRAVGLMEPVTAETAETGSTNAHGATALQDPQQHDGGRATESPAASVSSSPSRSMPAAAAASSVEAAEDQSQCRSVRAKLRDMARRKEINEAKEAARIVAKEAAAAAAAAAAANATVTTAAFVPSLPPTHASSTASASPSACDPASSPSVDPASSPSASIAGVLPSPDASPTSLLYEAV